MIAGHETVVTELERELPPVTLLLGPQSIGKTTVALHAAHYHSPYVVHCERVSAETARRVVQTAPVRHRRLSVYVLELDNSTEAAQNILLKILEEPPAHCRFLLVASTPPLATIISRSRVHRLALLSDGQVAEVLRQRGVSAMEADLAAARGRGQVKRALASVEDKDAARVMSVVAAAVRGASEGNVAAMDLAMRNWSPEHTKVLERWAMEKAAGRWVNFSADFAPHATRRGALNMLYVLGTYDARTAAAVALDVLKEPR